MIKTDICVGVKYSYNDIKEALVRSLPIDISEIKDVKIIKKSLKIEENIYYKLTVGVSFDYDREAGLLKMKKKVFAAEDFSFSVGSIAPSPSPVIVGAGPAGLFAALILAEAGAEPIVLERGESIEERRRTVDAFNLGDALDADSNVQFGEGGAGAFSDGKLKVGGMDKYKYKVLEEFVKAGAPEDIIYTVGAHLGTDKLPLYVSNIREKIKSFGATFIYRARVVDIISENGKISGVKYEKDGKLVTIDTDRVILAAGHSAKDTFLMLKKNGVPMESRGFGIGVRIEHPREYINSLVYRDPAVANDVGTASYHLVTHLGNGRSVYSFCMCPGGTVVAAASENGGIVTNGMSEFARDADNSNAAFLVSVTKEDFDSCDPLSGIELQRKIERLAYSVSGDWRAPVCRLGDFLSSKDKASVGDVKPSYERGTVACRPEKYLPEYITESLAAGILDFDKWMPGFNYYDAVMTGAETRSTSPIRVLRNEKYESPALSGLYPIGEGAGYSGGIVSSATDGVRVAESIVNANKR